VEHLHADRAAYDAAAALIASFGEYAAMEAAARAERSRNLGNLVHFCRWRQIERTIAMLAGEQPRGSIH